MRPEGCQETARRPARRDSPQPTDFKPVSRLSLLDAVRKRDLYSSYDQSTLALRRAGARRAARSCGPARSAPRRSSVSMYVSVAQRRRRAGPRPRTGRLRRPRGQRRARSAAGRAGRRADADRHARRHQPGRARRHPHMRTALPPFVAALTGRRAARTRSRSSRSASGRRSSPTTRPTPATLKKGDRPVWATPDSGAYLLDGIVEVCQGSRSAKPRRPVIVAITTEGPELSNRHHDQVLEPLRDSGAAFHAITLGPPSSSLSDEVAQPQHRARPGAARRPAAAATQLLTSMALAGRLQQLADELTHQYRVTYARPQSLIPPERVTVAAAKPGLTARGTLIKEAAGTPVTASSFRRVRCALVAAARRRARDRTPSRRRSSRRSSRRRQPQAPVPRRRRSRVAERHGHRRHRRAT